MDAKVIFDERGGFFIVHAAGRMDADGYTAMAKDILSHPHWAPGRHGIFNHQELDFSETTPEDLRRIREFHRTHETDIGGGKTAIVVKPGYAKKWEDMWTKGEKLVTENTVRVFEFYLDAVAWLCA